MKGISIKVISRIPRLIEGMLYHLGQIKIREFEEKFLISLSSWKIEDYKKQWKEGLERIKKKTKSCLVSNVENLETIAPLINIWGLYKEKDKIFIRNYLFFGKRLVTKLKKETFTSESCYKFIPKRRIVYDIDDKPSEWVIKLEK